MIAFSPNPGLELVTQGRKSIAFWAPHHAAFDRLVMYEPTLNPVGTFQRLSALVFRHQLCLSHVISRSLQQLACGDAE